MLKFVLIIVLVALAVLALGVWWLIAKFKGIVTDVMEASTPHPPCRINPMPEPNPQWRNPETMRDYSQQFLALGFVSAGTFTIPETGGLQLAAFVHEGEQLYGVAYDHEKIPPNVDIVCDYEDGSEMCASNTKIGETVERQPEVVSIRLDGGSVCELLEAVQRHETASPRIKIQGDRFAEGFKASYARSMNWKLKNGGTSREEIRRQAQQDGTEVTDELIEETYKSMRGDYVTELQSGCISQYLDQARPSPTEWERIEHRVFAVPETLTAEEVREILTEHCRLDEEQTHKLEQIKLNFGQTALDFMRVAMEGDPGSLGVKRLGAVSEPVGAELFLVMQEDSDDE
jgi:hypothetical protein